MDLNGADLGCRSGRRPCCRGGARGLPGRAPAAASSLDCGPTRRRRGGATVRTGGGGTHSMPGRPEAASCCTSGGPWPAQHRRGGEGSAPAAHATGFVVRCGGVVEGRDGRSRRNGWMRRRPADGWARRRSVPQMDATPRQREDRSGSSTPRRAPPPQIRAAVVDPSRAPQGEGRGAAGPA